MRAITGCALGVLLVASAGLAQEKIDEKKLVGKWQPADKKENVTIEFTKDGKLKVSVEIAGKTETVEGTYKLDGNKLSIAVPFAGAEQKDEITITKLTDDEMETESKGKVDMKVKKETLKKLK
jgi:uncharacterized protein (TIGR03066 family)